MQIITTWNHKCDKEEMPQLDAQISKFKIEALTCWLLTHIEQR